MDSTNKCCLTIRDEKGICCQSGILDECHICDGDSTSCATNMTMVAEFIDATMTLQVNGTTVWKDFMLSLITDVCGE